MILSSFLTHVVIIISFGKEGYLETGDIHICFDDNDNEIMPSPYAPNSQNSYVPGSQSPPYVPIPPSPPTPSIHTIPPYMLNHIQRFVGPETTRDT